MSHSTKGDLFYAYHQSPYLSIKYDTYFDVYEKLLKAYRGREIVLVEVGVFQGGSLFMWREFFGPKARIIGIDLNPDAREWEKHGFEICTGDQSSSAFWTSFYEKVGRVDVVIDDGGHTNKQQIITSHHAIQNINDGGLLIIEDVHTNYFREFGNPSKYSFVSFAHRIVDGVNSRSCSLRRSYAQYSDRVFSVSFFESMVAIEIDSRLCIRSTPTSNNGASRGVKDFRYHGRANNALFTLKNKLASNQDFAARLTRRVVDAILSFMAKSEAISYRKYFRNRE